MLSLALFAIHNVTHIPVLQDSIYGCFACHRVPAASLSSNDTSRMSWKSLYWVRLIGVGEMCSEPT